MVLDGLHPGDGPPSFQERRSPGPLAQLGPIHGPGLPAELPPDGAQEIPGRKETVAGEATGGTNKDGLTFHGSTESRTEGATARGETKRLDLGDNVEAPEPTQGSGSAGDGGLQREPHDTGGGQESGRHRYNAGDGGT